MAIATAYGSGIHHRYQTWPKKGLQIMLWDNNLGCYPKTGTTIKDLSGNGYNGTLNNFSSPKTIFSGYQDGALQFDGGNDYISFPNTWLANTTEYTLFVVFRRTEVPNNAGGYTTSIVGGTIGQHINLANYNEFYTPIVEITASLGTYYNACFNGSETSVLLNPLIKDFHQIAVCIKPGLIRTYIDGVLNDEQAITIGAITDNRRIPTLLSSPFAQNAFTGNIPVFIGYDRFLEQEDISQLYTFFNRTYNDNFIPTFSKNKLKVMLWDKNPDSYSSSSATIYDLTGNSNDGTLNNFSQLPVKTSGFQDGIINFNGNNNYITFPRTWLTNTTEFTLFVIFRRTGAPNNYGSYTTSIIEGQIGQHIKVANYNEYYTPIIEITASVGTYYNSCSNGSETSVLLDPLENEFHQIAVCVKPNLVKTYFDGVLNDEQIINIGAITDLRRIPSLLSSSFAQNSWTGNIPVFMGYEKALLQDEVIQLYDYFKAEY